MPNLKPGSKEQINSKTSADNSILLLPVVKRKISKLESEINYYSERIKTGLDHNYNINKLKFAKKEKEIFLKEILNVESYINLIKSECSVVLESCIKNKKFLYRGYRKNIGLNAFKGKPREDRKPKDTGKKIHALIDELFLLAGIKATRSNSIFCSSDYSTAESYGEVYIIFPKNGFDFSWSTEHSDFYSDFAQDYTLPFIRRMVSVATSEKNPVSNQSFEDTINKIYDRAHRIIDLSHNEKEYILFNNIANKIIKVLVNVHSFYDSVYSDSKLNLQDVNRFFNLINTLNTQPNIRKKFITEKEMNLLGNWFSFKLKQDKNVGRGITKDSAIEFLTSEGFTDMYFNYALNSDHEICIHGEYYAFNEEIFGRIFQKLLFSK